MQEAEREPRKTGKRARGGVAYKNVKSNMGLSPPDYKPQKKFKNLKI
jgi:hypothetical protein